MNADTYGIAVFPFLKTRSPISIAGVVFQSTDKFADLTPEQAKSVSDISKMLFLKDDLRIRSASFAIIPNLNIHNQSSPDMIRLSQIQEAVAYLYGSPHPILGDIFLSPEHASMAIFNPDKVSIYALRQDHNVESSSGAPSPSPNDFSRVPGFNGLYNFKHFFWAAEGSRSYGPLPQLTLNIAQDLADDITSAWTDSAHFEILFGLLNKPSTEFSLRVFSAIHWFNRSCRATIDDDEAIVNMSIAFESLLALPQAEKTDRLVDSISLILGRVPRLGAWARQFYDARSKVVHEGRAQQLRFVVADDSAKKAEGQIYQSLLAYGRQIFRLCLGTLVVGASMAEAAGLEEKLISNQERFEKICRHLNDEAATPCDRLTRIAPLVDAVERYRFVAERLKLATVIGATRSAAKAFLACESSHTPDVASALKALVDARRDLNHLSELEALNNLDAALPENASATDTEYGATFRKLFKVVWMSLFPHYHWIKQSG